MAADEIQKRKGKGFFVFDDFPNSFLKKSKNKNATIFIKYSVHHRPKFPAGCRKRGL
jgi:hypothetical protein